jgi:hypothetical protein
MVILVTLGKMADLDLLLSLAREQVDEHYFTYYAYLIHHGLPRWTVVFDYEGISWPTHIL